MQKMSDISIDQVFSIQVKEEPMDPSEYRYKETLFHIVNLPVSSVDCSNSDECSFKETTKIESADENNNNAMKNLQEDAILDSLTFETAVKEELKSERIFQSQTLLEGPSDFNTFDPLRFSNMDNRKRLMAQKHGHECSVCGVVFGIQNNLQRHAQKHKSENRFACTMCNKTFYRKDHLNLHLNVHMKIKRRRSPCEVKSGNSAEEGSLRMTCATSKTFECKICGAFFSRPSNLNSHLLLHSGHKPHVCDICKKAFSRRTHLRSHKLIHSGEKPYECKICCKHFRRADHLKGHLESHK